MGLAKNRPTTKWGMMTIMCALTTLVLPSAILYGPIYSIVEVLARAVRIFLIVATMTWFGSKWKTPARILMI